MARRMNRLSARSAATVTKPGMHSDGGCLYLHVDNNGARSWVFVFHQRGKRREMGMGPLHSVPLVAARVAAQQAREAVYRGEDPIANRRRKRAAEGLHTFGAVADAFVDDMERQWKNPVHRAQWRSTLTNDARPLREKPVSQITTEDILSVLKPMWQVKQVSASRLRGRIERVLDAAKVKGLREGENPARWRGHLALLLPTRQKSAAGHHAAMSLDKLPELLAALRRTPSASARALEFTILTAARTGEAIGAHSSEIDLENGIWTVPAKRMKAQRDHRVPLSRRALELVVDLIPEGGGFLFPGRKRGLDHLSNMAMLKMLQQELGHADATVHGFRSCFKDWASDRTNFQREIIEAALAHAVGDAAEQAYRRGDALEKRRQLMEAWSAFCSEERGNVINFAG